MNTAFSNAERVSEKHSRLSRTQLLHIRDCARTLIQESLSAPLFDGSDNGSANEEFLQAYKKVTSALALPEQTNEYDTDEANHFTDISAQSFGAVSRALLCKYIADFSKKNARALSPEDFFRCEPTSPDLRIAYVKNAYSDVAYRAFSSVITNSSVVYPGSFSAVCEEVYNNRAGFCILPYETSDEGALSGFRQLIIKYELVQIMSCSVAPEGAGSGARITRFALLSKGFRPSVLPKNAPRFLKIIIDSPSCRIISDICDAAELSSLRHIKSESIPVAWDTERYSCAMTFSLGHKDPTAFLLYLALEVPQSRADSLYSVV